MYKLLIVWIRSNKVGRKSLQQGKPTKMVGDELRITPGLLGRVSPGKSSIISMCLTHRKMLVHLRSSGETKKVGQECGHKELYPLWGGRHPPSELKNK